MKYFIDGDTAMPMQIQHFILDDNGKVIPATLMQYAAWFQTAIKERIIEQTLISEKPHVWVSTVFLGVDHNFDGKGKPLIFETMVFRDGDGDGHGRYATRGEAEIGHARAVIRTKEAIILGRQ